jgi:hypothetical protein
VFCDPVHRSNRTLGADPDDGIALDPFSGAVEDMDTPAERHVSDKTGRQSSQPCSGCRLPKLFKCATKFYILIVADRLDIIRTYD